MSEIERQLKIIRRGVTEIIPEEELVKKLKCSLKENRPLKIKYGIDPTASELHLGHSVPIRKLRDFQNLGHHVIFLVGDFTGLIGDPTGRTETRPLISAEEIKENLKTYRQQIKKLLDLKKTEFVYNSHWLQKLNLKDVINLASSFTVAQMLEREDFSQRYQKGNSISLQEFLYPLLQGYDSVALNNDVEIGATEQKFNLLAGRTIQEAFGMEKQVVITVPILEGTDGVRKMSKSYGNYIPITASANDMFGKIMSLPDSIMERYFRCLTDIPEEELKKILSEHPKETKERLAEEVTTFYHGKDAASSAREEFGRVFSQRSGIPSKVEIIETSLPIISTSAIVEILVKEKIISSKGEAKRIIRGGGLEINGVAVSSLQDPLEKFQQFMAAKEEYLARIGKRRFLKIVKS